MATEKLDLLIDRPAESIPERVVRRVMQAIADGLLPPGRRLTERELMELTGVSRTSIREAVRHLQTLGLVETSPSRGVRVSVLGTDEVREIYEMREALESKAAELFTRRATDAEVTALAEMVKPMGSAEEQRTAIFEFDELLLDGARNSMLKATLGALHVRIHALRSLSLTVPGRREQSVKEYLELTAAIEARSPERAAQAARRHVQEAAKAALEAAKVLPQQ